MSVTPNGWGLLAQPRNGSRHMGPSQCQRVSPEPPLQWGSCTRLGGSTWETPTRSPSFPRTRDAHGAKRDEGAQGPAAQHTHLQTFRSQGGSHRGWPAWTGVWVSVVGASGPSTIPAPSRARGKEPVYSQATSQAEGKVGGRPITPAPQGHPRKTRSLCFGGQSPRVRRPAEGVAALPVRARLSRRALYINEQAGNGSGPPPALPNGVRRSPPGARHRSDLNSLFPLNGEEALGWEGARLILTLGLAR